MSCVYVLKNTVNDKMYVGQTINLKGRMADHRRPSDGRFVIDRAINKYGWDSFQQNIFYIPDEELDYFEIELIKRLGTQVPNGYNVTPGGNLSSGMKGKNHSEEVKKRIGQSNLGIKKPNNGQPTGEKHPMYGRKHSKETIIELKRIAKDRRESGFIYTCGNSRDKHPLYGKHHSEESKMKMSDAAIRRFSNKENHPCYGKHLSDETKKKISIAAKKRYKDRVNNYNKVEDVNNGN